MVHIVLLSGGSGSRLWPLSNESRSKQFLKVLRDSSGKHVSMVQRVLSQLENSCTPPHDITIATCASQKNSLESQVVGQWNLVLEPSRRDTAAAVMLACANLALCQDALSNDTVVVLPIDTYAEDGFYEQIDRLDEAVQARGYNLALLGVTPTYPSQKFGYIVPAERQGEIWPVEYYKEKPSEELAEELVERGALWNCGVFAFQLGYMIDILDKYLSYERYEDLVSKYDELPRISLDYEVIEKANNLSVIPYQGTWKDLGTWNTLSEEMFDEVAGNVIKDSSSCDNVHIINETKLPMVVAGLKDAVVVATPDGILVSGKEESALIKDQVAEAANARPMYEQRKWGEYRVLDTAIPSGEPKSLVKELVISEGQQLSYQSHQNRTEYWVVTSGTGEVVVDEEVFPAASHSSFSIPSGTKHSCRAFDELHLIEVQLGEKIDEGDIVRYGHYWQD